MADVRQKGVILFAVMVILSILAMLLLSQMQMMLLYHRFTNQLIEKHFIFRVLESEAQLKIKLGQWEAACLRVSDDANGVLDALANQQGCALQVEQQPYNLIIEDLGTIACMQSVINNQLYSTHHWRISIKAQNSKQILQLRFAKVTRLIPCNKEYVLFIRPGIMSWRYLR